MLREMFIWLCIMIDPTQERNRGETHKHVVMCDGMNAVVV